MTQQSSRRLFVLLWLSYALFVVFVTTVPFDFDPSVARAVERWSATSSNPFPAPAGLLGLFSDMVQNVLLFAPLGALAALVLRPGNRSTPDVQRPRASTRSRIPDPRFPIPDSRSPLLDPRSRAAWFVIPAMSAVVGGCLSVAVETLQLFTFDRTSSLNDVLANVVGALSGAIIVLLVSGAARSTSSVRAADVLRRAYPVLLWSGVTAVAAWHPFDTTIDPGSIAAKITAVVANPWQAGLPGNQAVDAVRYALFAASFAVVWDRFRLPRATVNAVLAAALLGVVLETSKIFVLSRMPGLADVAIATLAGAAGAMLYRPFRQASRRVAAVSTIVAAWLAAAAMVLSLPVSSAPRQAIENPVAIVNDVASPPEWRVSHAVDLTLAFFPIGFAVGMVVRPPRVWLATAATGGVLAAALAVGQSWIRGSSVNVTDAGVLVLGAFAGAWAALPARAGSPDGGLDG